MQILIPHVNPLSPYAWGCDFDYGNQSLTRECYEGAAVSVRLIPLSA